jgi:hypothetical protein
MNLTAWVDVAIGLTIIYLSASLFVTIINEYIAQWMNLRGKDLYEALKRLIDDQSTRKFLKNNPALALFFDDMDTKKAGSYVDTIVLARTLVGSLAAPVLGPAPAAQAPTPGAMEQVAAGLQNMQNSALKTHLQAVVRSASNDMNSIVTAVSEWAERSLTMLGEQYKRKLQRISFGIGLGIAVAFNLDTTALVGHLYKDKNARDAAVAVAERLTAQTDQKIFEKCTDMSHEQRKADPSCGPILGLIDTVLYRNKTMGSLPIGWDTAAIPTIEFSFDFSFWRFKRIVGWVLTALAISLGAPFWFDLLNQFVNVRHGMRKPEVKE